MKKLLITVAFALVNAPAALAGSSLWNWYLFPAVASAPGRNGTYFRTDVTLTNPFPWRAVTVKAQFWRAGVDNTGAAARTYTIQAGSTLHLEDVVAREFGTGGGGALLVESQSVDGASFGATSRTYTANAAGAGTFGLSEPGQWYVAGQLSRTVLSGVRVGGGFRTNTGAASASPVAIDLRVDVLDRDGAPRATRTVTLPPFSSTQLSVDELSPELGIGSVIWTCLSRGATPAQIQWTAYATPIDNATGDSSFVEDAVDDRFTTHQNSHDLTGIWEGTHTGTFAGITGTAPTKVIVIQRGPHVSVASYGAYDLQTAYASGYEERGELRLWGGATVLPCLKDTSVVTGSTNGLTWSGTITGTGCYGTIAYSYTRIGNLSGAELEAFARVASPGSALPSGRLLGRIATPGEAR